MLKSTDRIEIHGRKLVKRYGDRDLSFPDIDIGRGESVALTGPSGSGKSTLLGLLAGVIAATSGTVACSDERAVAPQIAWIPQTNGAFPRRSVIENVFLGVLFSPGSVTHRLDRCRHALEAVKLSSVARQQLRQCSGGERQRVAVARAIVSQRPFIYADEPTGQLDRRTGEEVLDALMPIAHDAGVLVATHDPNVVARCDRTISLIA